jgi:hypothetical protein
MLLLLLLTVLVQREELHSPTACAAEPAVQAQEEQRKMVGASAKEGQCA